MDFQTASINWSNNKRQFIKANSTPLIKRQLNMLIPEIIREDIMEYIENRRKQIETAHNESERSRLALEFEASNPAPHSKDYR